MKPADSPCLWPIRRISTAIARRFPAFENSRVVAVRRAHNLVVAVDGHFIFKFPWHPRAECNREIRILRALHGKVGVSIPTPRYVGPRGRFFGYPRIPGHQPRVEEVRRWSRAKRAALARDLALLCVRIQRAIPLASRRRILGPKRPPELAAVQRTEQDFQRIFAKSPALVAASRRVFADYRRRISGMSPRDLRYVGFDLQFDNLLVDPAGRLVGAVDFGYLTWRDAPGLFGLLHKDDPGLARLTMKAFEPYAGTLISPRQAAIDGLFDVFSYLVELSTNRWDLSARRREWLAIAKRGVRARRRA